MNPSGRIGFHGMLPSMVGQQGVGVSAEFLSVWRPWLADVMSAMPHRFGQDWLGHYLHLPFWRFAIGSGVCSQRGYIGVMMPSVDVSGHYLPLTIVAECHSDAALLATVMGGRAWFERLEALAMGLLDGSSNADAGRFYAELMAIDDTDRDGDPSPWGDALEIPWRAGARHRRLPGVDAFAPMLAGIVDAHLRQHLGPYSMWWTDGSERVGPACVVESGLPQPADVLQTADSSGDCQREDDEPQGDRAGVVELSQGSTETEPVVVPGEPLDVSSILKVDGSGALTYRSFGMSDVGTARKLNEDAILERPIEGLWAVADGVGGQDSGDVASRTVVDRLDATPLTGPLDDRVERVSGALQLAHAQLAEMRRAPRPINGASTVAAMVGHERKCAFIWAGDSRIYRLRSRRLTRCTRDHSVVQALVDSGKLSEHEAQSHAQSNMITRAVGSREALELEVAYGESAPGDRYLLCSDGVHGVLSDDEIAQCLSLSTCDQACNALIGRVLEVGAKDNTSAIVVEAVGDDLLGLGYV
jgi:type VI secretion system protein ImpM